MPRSTCLKQQRPNIGKYWDGVTYANQVTTFKSGETVVGTTWPYQVNLMAAEKPPLTVDRARPRRRERPAGRTRG